MNNPSFRQDPSTQMGSYVMNNNLRLNELKRGNGSETGKWLLSLADQAFEHGGLLTESSAQANEDDLQAMVKWVGKLFDEFELFRLEFNQRAAGTDLFVNSSPPNLSHTNTFNDRFEGHLTTRFWTMALDATSDKVDVYIMPSDLLLAFTTNRINQTEYRPFVSIQAGRLHNTYCWMVDNQAIHWEMLSQLAKELFSDLINVASGNMTEEELHTDGPPNTQRALSMSDSVTAYNTASHAARFQAEDPYQAQVAATNSSVVKPIDADLSQTAIQGSSASYSKETAAAVSQNSSNRIANPATPIGMPDSGPALQSPYYPTSDLSPQFLAQVECLCLALDNEMSSLGRAEANYANDLVSKLKCKKYTNELATLRSYIVESVTRMTK